MDKLEEVAEVNIGQPMLFTWVEAVREFLEDRKRSQENDEERLDSRIGMTEVDIMKMFFCLNLIDLLINFSRSMKQQQLKRLWKW